MSETNRNNFGLLFWQHFRNAECLVRAATLAYTTMFALVPLLVLCVSTVRNIPFMQSVGEQLEEFIVRHITVVSSDIVSQHFHQFVEQANQLSSSGFIFLFISCALLFWEVKSTLNRIWCVSSHYSWLASISQIVLAVLFPVIFTVAVMADYYLLFYARGFPLFAFLSSFMLLFSSLVLVYKLLPDCMVSWKVSICSALLATLLFGLVKYACVIFSFFYGLSCTVWCFFNLLSFMMWLYISWVIILVGVRLVIPCRKGCCDVRLMTLWLLLCSMVWALQSICRCRKLSRFWDY